MASARAGIELTINGKTWKVGTVEQLRQRLKAVRATQFSEVWLRRADATSLAILVNRRSAWLTYFRDDGGQSFSSRNADYAGPDDATMEFLLSNGQMDEYPVAYTIPTSEALRAAEHYFRTGERSPRVTWEED
jgi:hypothetical protein